MKTYYVYILANKKNGTLYTGVTNNLRRRVWQHKTDVLEGFNKKYGVHNLVWYETSIDVLGAITREKQIKKWNRQWKIDLIEEENPEWMDLYEERGRRMDSRLRGNDMSMMLILFVIPIRGFIGGFGVEEWIPACAGVTCPLCWFQSRLGRVCHVHDADSDQDLDRNGKHSESQSFTWFEMWKVNLERNTNSRERIFRAIMCQSHDCPD